MPGAIEIRRTAITSPELTPPVGPFSQAIEAGGFIYFSGQVGQDPTTGKLVAGGIAAETERVFGNLSAVLKAAGRSFDDVVRAGVYLAVFVLSLNARAQSTQDERQYADGPVTLVQEIAVEYGHFDDYIGWLNSTWKPTMEATKEAGIIVDYKVFSSTPPSPDHPDVILWITYKNMAALDRGVEEEAVARKVICSTDCQNKARVGRNEYRKVTRREYIRELVLK